MFCSLLRRKNVHFLFHSDNLLEATVVSNILLRRGGRSPSWKLKWHNLNLWTPWYMRTCWKHKSWHVGYQQGFLHPLAHFGCSFCVRKGVLKVSTLLCSVEFFEEKLMFAINHFDYFENKLCNTCSALISLCFTDYNHVFMVYLNFIHQPWVLLEQCRQEQNSCFQL